MNTIELFSGAGGLALGFEKAGFHHLMLTDHDKACMTTLQANRPHWNTILDDIHNVDFTQYKGKVKVLTGGFPCQAFSYAGKKLGFADTRGTLFFEMGRAIKECEPDVVLAENVRGFSTHDKGRTLETVLAAFDELGYDVEHRLVNAWEHNVPQRRERYIIIGLNRKTMKGKKFNFPRMDQRLPVVRDALKDVPKSQGIGYSSAKLEYFKKIPEGGNWKDLSEPDQKKYMGKSFYSGGGKTGILKRLHRDDPSLTILTSPAQKQTERCHPTELRPLTIRESARIQTFPDDWKFLGSISNQYKQIGNAVPVNLAYALAKEIRVLFD